MIVFDLEWTQPFGQDSMEEIIQIGAVKIASLINRVGISKKRQLGVVVRESFE